MNFSQGVKEEISSSYRNLAKRVHPDKNKHPLANEAFLHLSSSYSEAMLGHS